MKQEGFIRNLVFGVEDGLVSTVGFVSGLAVSAVSPGTLLLTAIILVFVEAFSMAGGSFLSESSVQDFRRGRRSSARPSLMGGAVMFLAYLGAGGIVVVPYAFMAHHQAFAVSIFVALSALFLLGLFSARLTGNRSFSRGLRMVTVGGIAIGLGIVVARIILPLISA